MNRRCFRLMMTLAAFVAVGCTTLPPMHPVDVNGPGWTRRHGQAVWRFGKNAPEIVGDLMVAVNDDGSMFAQFSKSVVNVATAQTDHQQWVLDLPMFDRTLTGRGAPSDRFALFQFDEILLGVPLPGHWEYAAEDESWRLFNSRTGEYMEGYWDP